MKRVRYLTKSRFKLGLECPTKLFYTGKKEYPDSKLEDSFLAALAEGGYQVGELAKHYFPGGTDIETLSHEEAEAQTLEMLAQDNVVIYEPAIRFGNLFVRIDILVKSGNHFDLIEVKAKSYDSSQETPFFGKRGGINTTWKPYLQDVAFQKYVLSQAFPEASINCYLMLADKHAQCTTDGLNQKFRIARDSNNRKGIIVSSSLCEVDLKDRMLIQVPVDEAVSVIEQTDEFPGRSFVEQIHYLAEHYVDDRRVDSRIGTQCKKCEFRCSSDEEASGFKSGFKECWKRELDWRDSDLDEATVLDIWNYRQSDRCIEAGRIKLAELDESDIGPVKDSRPGLSGKERQWLQVEKVQSGDTEPYFDVEGMRAEMAQWTYPLHFIDFETTAVALPFTSGRKPYEGIAFQFSHHMVHEGGRIEHAGEYLNTERGFFPNYDFVRALKQQLDQDNGTIFRYAAHENSYLNLIYRQLREDSDAPEDRDELCVFIKSITKSIDGRSEKWLGERNMVDMLQLVKRYYYDPATNGLNSIKYVLPAILNSSKYLQSKYSQPIYGAENGIFSHNFKDWRWIEFDNGRVLDPYKRLPKLFEDASEKDIELLSEADELNNGGAALTAYAKLQFEEMSEYERVELKRALKSYCELDTFAMVMIYEAWNGFQKCSRDKDETMNQQTNNILDIIDWFRKKRSEGISGAECVRLLSSHYPGLSRSNCMNILMQGGEINEGHASTYYYNYYKNRNDIADSKIIQRDDIDDIDDSSFYPTSIVRNSLLVASEAAKTWFEDRTYSIEKAVFDERGGLDDDGSGAVYAYYEGDTALYVGITGNKVKSRLHTPTSPHAQKTWWKSWNTMRFIQLSDDLDRQLLEYLLIVAYKPANNAKPKGKDLANFLPD